MMTQIIFGVCMSIGGIIGYYYEKDRYGKSLDALNAFIGAIIGVCCALAIIEVPYIVATSAICVALFAGFKKLFDNEGER